MCPCPSPEISNEDIILDYLVNPNYNHKNKYKRETGEFVVYKREKK